MRSIDVWSDALPEGLVDVMMVRFGVVEFQMVGVCGCGGDSLIAGVISVVDNSDVVGINVDVLGNWCDFLL